MQSEQPIPQAAFEIITSLRWKALPSNPKNEYPQEVPQLDGIPIHYHRDRLLAAAKAFNFPSIITLLSNDPGLVHLHSKLLTFSTTLTQNQTYKLRLTVSPIGAISITASPPLPPPLFPFSLPSPNPLDLFTLNASTLPPVYLFPSPITPSLHTAHKTAHRQPYDIILSLLPPSLRHAAPTKSEVLLYNPSNEITECIYSTPYFFRDGKLITPSTSCGGNMGVTRRMALEKVWCVEGVVMSGQVREGEVVVVSNAVRGFWLARVRLELSKEVDENGEAGTGN